MHLRHFRSSVSRPASVLLKIKNNLVVCHGANMVALRLPTVIGQLGTPQKTQRISKANSPADITLKSYSLCPQDLMQILQQDIEQYPHLERVCAVCMCKVHKLNLLAEAKNDALEMHFTGS